MSEQKPVEVPNTLPITLPLNLVDAVLNLLMKRKLLSSLLNLGLASGRGFRLTT